jgi:hypothetical protein
MASKITPLDTLTAANIADADVLPIVDVSDTSMAATGTNKKITRAELGKAVAQWVEVEVDFGSTPQWTKTFTVTDANVTTATRVAVVPSGNVATGRVGNDAEWDSLICTALPAAGSFTLTVAAFPGPVVGARKVQYQIAA